MQRARLQGAAGGAAAAAVVAVVVAGCTGGGAGDGTGGASAPPGGSGSSSPRPSSSAVFAGCPAGADLGDAPVLVRFTTGEGTADVRLVDSGPCAGGLLVSTGADVVGLDLHGASITPSSVRAVRVGGEVLVVGAEEHPRGGSLTHVWAVTAEGIAEVSRTDGPLLPFVATDTVPAAHLGVRCPAGEDRAGDDGAADDGADLDVVVAQPTPGGRDQWRVRAERLSLEGAVARVAGVVDVALDDAALRSRYGFARADRLFVGCPPA